MKRSQQMWKRCGCVKAGYSVFYGHVYHESCTLESLQTVMDKGKVSPQKPLGSVCLKDDLPLAV